MKAISERYREVQFRKDGTMQKKPTGNREPFALAVEEQEMAMKAFPQLSRWKALAAWHASDIGRKTSAAINRDLYEAQQRRAANGNAYGLDQALAHQRAHTAIGNGTGIQGGMGPGSGTYAVSAANDVPLRDSPLAIDKHAGLITTENVSVLMKRFGLTFDQAVSMLGRGGE
jgi:hypothetical protein